MLLSLSFLGEYGEERLVRRIGGAAWHRDSCEGIGTGADGRGGARVAGLDRRGTRDQWKPIRNGRMELGFAIWATTDRSTWAGIFAGAAGVRPGRGAGVGDCAEDEHSLWSGSESVRVQVDRDEAKKSEAVF